MSKFTSPKIAVCGEAFNDRYFVGSASRLSPEAPIPVVKVDREFILPGGAANVAQNLRSLGALVDEYYQPGARPTKNRLLVGSQQLARWDEYDTCMPITKRYHLKAHLESPDVDGVVLSDYGKGAFGDAAFEWLNDSLGEIPLYIDTKRDPMWFYPLVRPSFYFPNLKEYEEHRSSYDKLENVILKQGATGMSYLRFGSTIYKVPAKARRVVSVCGAGDSCLAGFSYAHTGGHDIYDSLCFANTVAAVVVEKPWTASATLREVEEYGS